MRFHTSPLEILSSPVRWKVASFLLNHEAAMSEREIAAVLKISHMSVNRAMNELAELNFVHCTTVGKAHLWKTNRKSYLYGAIQKINEAASSCPAPLEALKVLILDHLDNNKVQKIVLFGSMARGEERPDSDIDLLIIVAREKDKTDVEKALDDLSSAVLDMFGNRFAPYVLSEEEWKKKKLLSVVKAAEGGLKIYERK